jgi:tetratricopeptide (TPR) repeat protein
MDLASDEVNDELATLDPRALKLIFDSGYGSANEDIMHYVAERYAQFTGSAAFKPIVSDNRAMLCSLRGKFKNYAVYTPPSNATNAFTQQFVKSEYDLRGGDPAKQEAAVEAIGQVLDSLASCRGEAFDWSPDYYADLAIKASLHLGHRAEAQAILDRGLRLQPDSKELCYLARVLAREINN